ncbi:DUF5695 domain-containing protein [Asticcacaulis benevestitus]|uniref:Uncharacterized protein n=1 Tax=Asticcacaulis benevestitus DSM 16100 = ATCC BAA-896 TaxID=1121022 RepID=V4RIL5_9CAUL|nr:DUF5695 domain-containing protein [Asticcacaulis benevestitus]ESQ91158.1 hypothetical protein ABENE_10900 [Asticcacaulis benevestitus DSM 16100 = ATCC BAA-896]
MTLRSSSVSRRSSLLVLATVLLTGAMGGSFALTAAAETAAISPWSSPDAEVQVFETPDFMLSLQQTSQTLVSLAPKAAKDGFDFAPSGRFTQRLGDGAYRIGDLDLRLRSVGAADWQDYSTAFKRSKVTPLKVKGTLAAADITHSLGAGLPLKVTRTWSVIEGKLVLRYTLRNPGKTAIEIGGLGLPMVFDNIITGRHLDDAHETASFYDPYVGKDAGYLQVNRLNGAGPSLLVLPEKNTPFELYKPILNERNADKSLKIYNDPEQRNMTFEGFYDWMVASKGFADTDWKGIQQWNAPSSLVLKAGESRTIGVRFVLSPSVREIETTLIQNGRPVAVGLPGYVVPTDMNAELFVHSAQAVKSVSIYPEGALEVGASQKVKDGWVKYAVNGKAEGRARMTLTYADGSVQTVHYLVTKPEREVVADMGHFLTTKQWYENPSDPFKRSPSIMGYDRDKNEIITQDNRVWISGLSDEGGAGSWLATIMKQLDNPKPDEVAKFERFADTTLWGQIQTPDGADKYGVRKSVMFYDPKTMPEGTYDPKLKWDVWSAWDREGAADLGRSYNYPHVAAAWWTLYRLGRYHDGLTKAETWQTYLTRAAETTKAMMTKAPYYTQFGQMEGDVFVYILEDLKREGYSAEATEIETMMKARADIWKTLKYPFGSEMPWDSTGQAEVYMWSRYFGDDKAADTTREVILAYDPTIPHWGYNGSARRFWDFLYAGKQSRIERQLHHYGSSLNAVPLFDAYRANPKDYQLLRAAYGGLMGSLTNIDSEGFASAAFHSFPDAMHWDGMSGDYGMSFFGHAVAASSYLVDHPTFGWAGFGGNVTEANGVVTLMPKDSARTRVFIAPAGLWLTLDAGKFTQVAYDPATGKVTATLAPSDAYTPTAYLNVKTTTAEGKAYVLNAPQERGAYTVKLGANDTTLELTPKAN